MPDLQDLASNLERLSATVSRAGSKLLRASAVAVLQGVIVGTPVGNVTLWHHPDSARPGYVGGRARANWFARVGGPETGTTDEVDASGASAISNGTAAVADVEADQEVHITNNLPYIMPLNDGHSHQAPAGFIEVAVDAGMQAALAKWGGSGSEIMGDVS